MLPSVRNLLFEQRVKIQDLENEVKELKKRLQFSHTKINDLRYTKKQLIGLLKKKIIKAQ